MRKNARGSDPAGSHIAAGLNHSTYRQLVMDGIEALGPTSPEPLAAHYGLHYEKVWRRFSDLKNDGLIEVVDPGGHINKSGVPVDVLYFTEVGKRVQARRVERRRRRAARQNSSA